MSDPKRPSSQDTAGLRDSPQPQPLSKRPVWALAVFILGVLCSLVVGWISIDYAAGQARGEPPSMAMVSTIFLAPFLIAGLPLLLAGSTGVARPWSRRRPWLPWLIVRRDRLVHVMLDRRLLLIIS